MKKILLLLILTVSYLYANIGSITAVSGDVLIIRDSSKIKAKLNDIVQKNDTIKSIGASKAQILFLDKTVVTIGKDTVLNIAEYIVDNSSNSSVRLNVLDGLFRVITGKISKIAPDKFRVQTKNAMIGIRGTIFVGDTNSDRDKIACIKGAIIIESQGKSLDLFEGEIIYIRAGEVPRNPRKFKEKEMNNFSNVTTQNKELTNEIVESMHLGGAYLVDPSLEISFLQTLQDIDNVNNQAATYNMYVDSLYDGFYNLLDEKQFEVDVKGFAVNEYQDLFSDGYIPLNFTYYTYYEPKGDTISDLMEAIPIIVKRNDENTKITPENKIVEYMGGVDPWTQEIYAHWNGKASEKKLLTFEGNIIGQINAKSQEIKVFIMDPQENHSSVIVDFGNKFMTSYLSFPVPNFKTNEIKLSSYQISSADEVAVSTSGFFTYGDYYTIVNGKFYGDNLNQIAGAFTIEDLENDNNIYGEFVANNSAQYDVVKSLVGEDESFSWGYWNTELLGSLGAWIEPKIQNTPVNVISDYITQQELYTYSGGVIGTFSQISEGVPTQAMNGEFFLNIDFGQETLDGHFYLESLEDSFDISITQGVVGEKGFHGTEYILNAENSTKALKDLDMNGQFFGTQAEKIGGGIKFETESGDIGIGALIGTKSE